MTGSRRFPFVAFAFSLLALAPETAFAQKQACKTEQGSAEPKNNPQQRKKKTCQQKSESMETQEQEKCQKQAGQKEACCCGDPSGGAGGGGDQKKDEKKDEKQGGGGGSPQMPQIPQMPQQQSQAQSSTATANPIVQEQQRQARINSCKANAQTNLQTRQTNCEAKYPYDTNHPVESQKQLQGECKQTAIFQNQADNNTCEAQNPPTGAFVTMPGYSPSTSVSTATSTTH